MKQKILFVAHCMLNIASKVVMYEKEDMEAEEALRRRFVHAATDAGIQLIQMPCPEFTLYGARRWGHVSDQFDNAFFRGHCRALLEPFIAQLEEYLANPDRFEVLGFAGIDGSPSCGVDYTCTGNWGGNLSGRDIAPVIASVELVKRRGVFFDELEHMLRECGLEQKFTGLFAAESEKIMRLAG